MPRKPHSELLEPSTISANNYLRLDEDQILFPSQSDPLQHHPEQAIKSDMSGRRTPPLQSRKLLPKRSVLQEQVTARTKTSTEENDRSLSWRSMNPVLNGKVQTEIESPVHKFDLTEDRILAGDKINRPFHEKTTRGNFGSGLPPHH